MILIFFFNDTATTEIYTLSLHDALPIFERERRERLDRARGDLLAGARGAGEHHDVHLVDQRRAGLAGAGGREADVLDRKSTRLNSSHANISYAVFCLKKKKQTETVLSHI